MQLRLAGLDPLVDGFFRPALVAADHRVGRWKRLVLLDGGEGDAEVVGDFAARHEADHGLSFASGAPHISTLKDGLKDFSDRETNNFHVLRTTLKGGTVMEQQQRGGE